MLSKASTWYVLLGAIPFALGCVGYRTPPDDAGARPGANPTGSDAALDVGQDSGRDAAADLRPDLLPDLRPDLLPDLRADLPPDLRPDLPLDLRPDLPPDLRPDLRADVGADLRVDQRIFAGCTPGEPYVLALGDDSNLYRFDPSTLTLTRIAAVACAPAPISSLAAGLNSLSVSLAGPAYISNQEGDLCTVDTTSFVSTVAPFDSATATRRQPFGMAVVPDNSAAGQSLYISVQAQADAGIGVADNLTHVDLSSFATTAIGPIESVGGDAGVRGFPTVELTAGPSGQLYGFALGQVDLGENQSYLLTIDPSTGHATDVTVVNAAYSMASFALVDWQDTFYLFLGEVAVGAAGATIYTYHKGDSSAAAAGTLPVAIIGAGVTTCR